MHTGTSHQDRTPAHRKRLDSNTETASLDVATGTCICYQSAPSLSCQPEVTLPPVQAQEQPRFAGDRWWTSRFGWQQLAGELLLGGPCGYSLSFSRGFWCRFRHRKSKWLLESLLSKLLSHPFQQCPRNAWTGKAEQPSLDSPSFVQSASTAGGARHPSLPTEPPARTSCTSTLPVTQR